jgi:hypothetical protein
MTMRGVLGTILYLLALAITVLVIGAKYFALKVPPVTDIVMADAARSLIIALVLSLVARWV